MGGLHANIDVHVISRGKGRSTRSAMAYRHALKQRDPETGIVSDYRNRDFVVYQSEIIVDRSTAPAWARGLAEESRADYPVAADKFAALIDRMESRSDAQLFREFTITIPRELSPQKAWEYATEVTTRVLAKEGMIVDVAMHLYGAGHGKDVPLPTDVDLQVRDGQPIQGDHILWKGGKWYRYQPHAHAIAAMRPMTKDGLGPKRQKLRNAAGQEQKGADGKTIFVKSTDWDDKDTLRRIQANMHQVAKEFLAREGIEYITPAERGLAAVDRLPPEPTLGAAIPMVERGLFPDRIADFDEWRRASYEMAVGRPETLLNTLTRQKATFTEGELNEWIGKLSRGEEQATALYERVLSSPELVLLQEEVRRDNVIEVARVYSTQEMVNTEDAMLRAAVRIQSRADHALPEDKAREYLRKAQVEAGLQLTPEQQELVSNLLTGQDLAADEGYAGTGKTTLLRVANKAWEWEGKDVRGYALSRQATRNLEEGSRIRSTSIASLLNDLVARDGIAVYRDTGVLSDPLKAGIIAELTNRRQTAPASSEVIDQLLHDVRTGEIGSGTKRWLDTYVAALSKKVQRGLWTKNTVAIVDEAGMVDSRSFARLVQHADEVGAKFVPVGDREQAQPINAGGAMRALLKYVDYDVIQNIIRQKGWMREASLAFATRRTGEGIDVYAEHGRIHTGIQFVAADYVRDLERQSQRQLNDLDAQAATRVGRYLEARRAVGSIMGAYGSFKAMPSEERCAFAEWLGVRDKLIKEIVSDWDQHAEWIRAFRLSREKIAEHYLKATGVTNPTPSDTDAWVKKLDLGDVNATPAMNPDMRSGARAAILENWSARTADGGIPVAEALMTMHTRKDAYYLNLAAREVQVSRGRVTGGISVSTPDGDVPIGVGDRVKFKRGDHRIDVVNGMSGTVTAIDGRVVTVAVDKAGERIVDLDQYRDLTLGYAGTIHDKQGASAPVNDGHFTAAMDRHLTYVMFTRHTRDFELFASVSDAATIGVLKDRAATPNLQESTLDYLHVRPEPAASLGLSAEEVAYRAALKKVAQIQSLIDNHELAGESPPTDLMEEARAAREQLRERGRSLPQSEGPGFRPMDVEPDRVDRSISAVEREQRMARIERDPLSWLRGQMTNQATASEQDLRYSLLRLTEEQGRAELVLDRLRSDPRVAQLVDAAGVPRLAMAELRNTELRMLGDAVALAARGADPATHEAIAWSLDKLQEGAAANRLAAEILSAGGLHLIDGVDRPGLSEALTAARRLAGDQVRVYGVTRAAADLLDQGKTLEAGTVRGVRRALDMRSEITQYFANDSLGPLLKETLTTRLAQAVEVDPKRAQRWQRMAHEVSQGQMQDDTRQWVEDSAARIRSTVEKQLWRCGDHIVIADAHELASAEMAPLLAHARETGAHLVLVGKSDGEPRGAGFAFRALLDHVDGRPIPARHDGTLDPVAAHASAGDPAAALKELDQQGGLKVSIAARLDAARLQEIAGHPLSADEMARAETVLRYLELNRAYGRSVQIDPKSEMTFRFRKERNALAKIIGDDFASHRVWIERAGEGNAVRLAQHYLQAAGAKRDEAQVIAPDLARSWGVDDGGLKPQVPWFDVRQSARAEVLADWARYTVANPGKIALMVAGSRREAAALTAAAREALKAAGGLQMEQTLALPGGGHIHLGTGDRVRFTASDIFANVRAGDIGTVAAVIDGVVAVKLDNGDFATIDTQSYSQIQHAYAVTVREARHMTADAVFVLHEGHMRRNDLAAALSLHREKVRVYSAMADAPTADAVIRDADTGRACDSTLDYQQRQRPGLDGDQAELKRRLDEFLSASQAHRAGSAGRDTMEDARKKLIDQLLSGGADGAAEAVRAAIKIDPALLRSAGAWVKLAISLGMHTGRMNPSGVVKTLAVALARLAPRGDDPATSAHRQAREAVHKAQVDFAAALRRHGAGPDVDKARVALGEALAGMKAANRAAGLGVVRSWIRVDKTAGAAKGWAELAKGLGQAGFDAVMGMASLNPMQVAVGIFRALSTVGKFGVQQATKQMGRTLRSEMER